MIDYARPTKAEIAYHASKGLASIRLPFRWERLQPVPGGELNPKYLVLIGSVVDEAGDAGLSVILDCHNFGFHGGLRLGSPGLPADRLADLWARLADAFRHERGLGGYDLMNEPKLDFPTWFDAAQLSVAAIRRFDRRTPIYVEGVSWSSAARWLEANGDLHLHDPAGRIIYSAHCYLDRDGSGTHFDWSAEAAAGVTEDIGVRRLTPFVQWLQRHGYRGHVGEIGAGGDNPGWLEALDRAMAYCAANRVPVSYFADGPFWPKTYGYLAGWVDGADTPQMAVLTKYSTASRGASLALTDP